MNKPFASTLAAAAAAVSVGILAAQAAEPALGTLNMDTPALNPAEAKALKNPVANKQSSIKRGRTLYLANGCQACHGNDGKAMIEVVANATDLTNPTVYKNGSAEGEVFRSIRDGAGVAMPPFKAQISHEEDIWHLVNFVRSLWPAGQKPPLAAE
jgi:mono/diheme cytochrome c family protein